MVAACALTMSNSSEQSASGIDFTENEEVKVVICQDNSAAVTTTRRSQRNIGKKPRRYNIYSETDTSNDSFSSNSSTESPTKKKSLSAKSQVKVISPKRGPGRPRKNHDSELQRNISSPITTRPNVHLNQPTGKTPLMPVKSLRLKFSFDSGTASAPVNTTPIRRGPGRPRKNPPPLDNMKSSPVNGQSARHNDTKESFVTPRTKRAKTSSNSEESTLQITSKMPEKPKTPLDIIREEHVKERVDSLVQVVEEHDSLVRELYYMESYNMLMWDLDPQRINSDNSERMVKYLENHNLWSSLNDQVTNSIQSNSTRMSTRRSLNKHRDSILNMLQQSIGSRVFHNVMPSEHTSGDSDSGSRTHRRSSRVDSTNNRDNASSGGMSLYSLRKRGHAQFPSFEAYLESFVTLDDEDITPAEEEAKLQSEIDVDYRIWVLKNQGKLQPIPKPATEPPRQKTHWDFILDGVIAKSKRINKTSDERLRKTHQISRAILGHFNKLAMKEPNAIKAEEKRIKKLAKTTGNLIKQRWREISKFINDMHDKLVAEEEERRGKQKLNALFEDATQKIEFHEKYLMGTASTDNVIVNKTNEDDNNNQESGADVNSLDNDQMSIDEDFPLDFDHDDDLSTDPDMSEMVLNQNVEDDEASLEAQELEEDSEEEAVELNDLADEMNLPIDELLKRYGVNVNSEEDNEEDTDRSEEIKPVLNGTTNRDLKKNHQDLSLYDSDADSFSELETSTQSSNTTKTRTPIPSLLRGQLRAYQHDGLHWLASLYEQGSNGILADEMGLGKTIQTIALLAHLACDKGVWGPHLIIVPTSVIINWEMEFKKWCPGFIILTYYGSPKERKEKRLGWSKEHSFHVCITSYHLAVQDAINFRKKRWHYLILDEAHNIKNFKSQRWNTLLNFNSERRLLLTGTPLQNNLMELWSLLYFLKPNVRNDDMPFEYANQKEFQDWFSRPVDKMIENNEGFDEKTRTAILTLHTLLRPYLLRRLKIDVEKQLPAKHTHIIKCRLSKRQRFLYDDFMSRSKTKETLRSGNFLSIINCLMQLRKVCNHPDLFEVRPIVTSFAMSRSAIRDYEYCEMTLRNRLNRGNDYLRTVNFDLFNLLPIYYENMDWLASSECNKLDSDNLFVEKLNLYNSGINNIVEEISYYSLIKFGNVMQNRAHIESLERWKHMRYINSFRLKRRPIYGTGLINICRQLGTSSFDRALMDSKNPRKYLEHTNTIPDMVVSYERRYDMMEEVIKKYVFVTPAVVAADVRSYALAGLPEEFQHIIHNLVRDLYYPIRVKLMIAFPDKRLLQYDCGKLQELDRLLRNLKEKGHRALIFTQMTRVLDILEIFLNIHGHRYLRLDGATKIEQRQLLTERFNNDPRILVFILSTRSGGLGINLTGADTVIFYDIDWNPCMDRQCQDRCHRIGQTREVNIYRFVCEATIEENMLAKAQQKEMLDKMVITDGGFTTDFWSQPKVDWRDIVKVIAPDHDKEINDEPESGIELEQCLAKVEDDTDVNAAQIAKKEMESDLIEFDENAVTPAESSGGAENSVALVRRESTVSTAPSPLNENYDDDNLKSQLLPVELYMFRFMEYDLDKYVGFSRTFEYNSTEDINNEE